jgi:hypothetical protein
MSSHGASKGLASASARSGVFATSFGNGHADNFLRRCGVDPDRVGQRFVGQATLHGGSVPLHHLTRIGTDKVNAKHIFRLRLVYDYFCKAPVIASAHGERPFQRQE